MKYCIYLLALAIPLISLTLDEEQEKKKINWVTIEEAQELMKDEPRKIMMDVYTSWCGPCKMMMSGTFTNADLIDYVNENFYAVKFNAEGPDDVTFNGETFSNPNYDSNKKGRNSQHQFAAYMKVRAYPTIVYLDEDLNFLMGDSGYKTAQQMEIMLKLFAQDDYKDIETQEEWNAYQAEFKGEFK